MMDIEMESHGGRGGRGWGAFAAGAILGNGGLFRGNGGDGDCVSNSRFTDSLIAGTNQQITSSSENLASTIVSSANNTQAEGRSNFQSTWGKIDGVDTSVTAGNFALSSQISGVNDNINSKLCELQYNLSTQATQNTQALKDQAAAIDSKNTERLLDSLQDEVNALRYGNFPITRQVSVQECHCPPVSQVATNNVDVVTIQTMIGNGIQAALPGIIQAIKQAN